jgi:hypothetical protein
MEKVDLRQFGIYYCHWVYFMAIRSFSGSLVFFPRFGIFPPFWYIMSRKIWQPCLLNLSREKHFLHCMVSYCDSWNSLTGKTDERVQCYGWKSDFEANSTVAGHQVYVHTGFG